MEVDALPTAHRVVGSFHISVKNVSFFGKRVSMKEFPRGGLFGLCRRLQQALDTMNIPLHAANAGYFLILSLFPALVLLLSILRYTRLDIDILIGALGGVIPEALLPEAELLIINTYNASSGFVLGLSALTALWSASRGIYGLLKGLNAVYKTDEDRGYFYTRSISVVYTFLFFLVLILTLGLHVFGTGLVGLLENASGSFLQFVFGALDLRFFLLVFLQTALFTAMFMALPNRKNTLSDSLPGALLASIGWLVFSHLYSVYVEHFPSYANIYGSVYAIAVSMLWLYCCISILFYGGALNYFLMKHNEKQK